jgi:23S rRNA pseudouridine2605 synthase
MTHHQPDAAVPSTDDKDQSNKAFSHGDIELFATKTVSNESTVMHETGTAVAPAAGGHSSGQPALRPKPAGNRFDDVVSGQFDADEDIPEVVLRKRVLAPMAETPKIHKVLAQAGLGSRLEMEQLIMEGRITVNNEPAHIGQRVQFGDQVKVNGKPIRFRIDAPPPRVIAYHKPVGEVVTNDDPQNRPTVFRRLPKLHQGKWQSVGRLDLNTEGLLLFTSSGELANNLMHPRFGLEREYAVRVLGSLNREEKQKLLDGVKLDDGMAQFGSIEDGGGEGANCWYRVTISEGRNREVRRMFEAVGHAVSRLIRIRYGAMVLPRGLKRGAWMELDDVDIRAVMHAAGSANGPRRGERPGGRPPRGADTGNQAGHHRVDTGADGSAGGFGPGTAAFGVPGTAGTQGTPGNGRNRHRGARVGGPRGAGGPGGPGGVGNGQRDMPPVIQGSGQGPASGPVPGQGQGQGQGRGRNRTRPDTDMSDDGGDRADRQAAEAQPDPMKTAFGYIGADSFMRQRQGQGPRRGGGSGQGGGQGGGMGGNSRGRGGRGR